MKLKERMSTNVVDLRGPHGFEKSIARQMIRESDPLTWLENQAEAGKILNEFEYTRHDEARDRNGVEMLLGPNWKD